MKLLATILFIFLCSPVVSAQNYTATNGSSYIGALHVHNNPASIVNDPVKWNIALFGFQEKHTTNILKIKAYSKANGLEITYPEGTFKRYADVNFNLNLLNTRIAINRRSAIAFGANLKSYTTAHSGSSYFSDTVGYFARYFLRNEGSAGLEYTASTSNWAELYLAYGRTITDNEAGRLNAGLTLKINKGLGGAFFHLGHIHFARTNAANPPSYRLSRAELDYGYSSNYDRWDDKRSFSQNFNDFVSGTKSGGSIDIGLEYLVKLQSVGSVFEDERHYDYDWKIGLSVLDIGYSQYRFGAYSTRARNLNANVTDDTLDQVFGGYISSLGELRDSLSRLYTPLGSYVGTFPIGHPARVVLNIDKFITDAFFINADISVSLSSFSRAINLPARDLNLITLTGRWETRNKGYYFPIYFNNRNQLWMGGAVRLGPVLFGVHNWSNLFSKKKIHRGGLYLSVILKASGYTGTKADRRLGCPP